MLLCGATTNAMRFPLGRGGGWRQPTAEGLQPAPLVLLIKHPSVATGPSIPSAEISGGGELYRARPHRLFRRSRPTTSTRTTTVFRSLP